MTLAGTKCAVLGAGGFIGTNLCLALTAAQAEVTAIGRKPHEWPEALSATRWVETEFTDAPKIAHAIADQDFVFHLLGGSVPARSNDDPVSDVEQSLIPSLRLMEACSTAGVQRLVFISSGGTVYGPAGPSRLTEASPTDPITAYGVNKLAVEKYLGLFRHLYGLDSIVLRVANPYGPYQHRRRAQGIVGTVLARALSGETIEIWGDGSIVRDYIYIDDVVAAITKATEYGGDQRLFNIGSGQERAIREVVGDICALTSTPLSRVVYHDGRAADVPYNVLDSTLAKQEMGWQPDVEWLDGLKATATWLGADSTGADRMTQGRSPR